MQGLFELRDSVSKYLTKNKKNKYEADNIMIGPGTKELMLLLQIAFEGDILLPIPSWVSYFPQALIGRNKIHWLNTKKENNWFPSAEEIERTVIKNKMKKYILFLNSPNNPSGNIFLGGLFSLISAFALSFFFTLSRKYQNTPVILAVALGNLLSCLVGFVIAPASLVLGGC